MSTWLSGGEESKVLHEKLDEKIDSYAAGELGHAAEAISSIWNLSRKNGALPSISQGKRGSPHKNGGFFWGWLSAPQGRGGMRTSLVKSIQGGPLLHRKYWARQSRGGSICPIYIPTAVSGSTLLRVSTCEWNHILGCHERAESGSGRVFQGR